MKSLLLAFVIFGSGIVVGANEVSEIKPPASEAAAEKPLTREAAALKQAIIDLYESSKKVASPDSAEKKKAQTRVEQALDWERIAKDCFDKKLWSGQSAKNQAEFRGLLKDVVVRTAFGRLDKFWKDTKKYDVVAVEVKGATAHVATKFLVDKEDFLLEYFLTKQGGRWLIYDIAYEDLKYSENISEQIAAFMKDHSFTALLGKLRKRRDELKQDKT